MKNNKKLTKDNVLLRGACDVTAIIYYLKKDNNVFVENCLKGKYINVAWDLTNSIYLMQAAKRKKIISPFVEPIFYPNDLMFSGFYKYIILSTLSDGIMGTYENKLNHEKIAYGNCTADATFNNGELYFNDNILHSGIPTITKEQYVEFAKEYEFKGRISPEECVENWYSFCKAIPSSTKIIFLLGSTIPNVYGEKNPAMLLDNFLYYGKLKMELMNKLKGFKNIAFVDPDPFYKKPKSKIDMFFYSFPTINHYPCITYFQMAKKLEKLTDGNISASNFKYIKKKIKRYFFGFFKKRFAKK